MIIEPCEARYVMKQFLLASVGIAALGIASASAADLPVHRSMPTKAPVYSAPAMYDWSGPYIGINGGYGFGGTNDGDGGLVGATLGYNYQSGPWVLGLEGDMNWTNIKGSSTCGGTSCSTENHWLGTARARLGYAMGPTGRIMPYVTGGAAFGDIENSAAGVGTVSDSKAGWTIGGGLEAALSGPWTAKVEYLYVDLGDGPTIGANTSSFDTNIIRAGLNYKF
jgi:outer membrane immunogenic protein